MHNVWVYTLHTKIYEIPTYFHVCIIYSNMRVHVCWSKCACIGIDRHDIIHIIAFFLQLAQHSYSHFRHYTDTQLHFEQIQFGFSVLPWPDTCCMLTIQFLRSYSKYLSETVWNEPVRPISVLQMKLLKRFISWYSAIILFLDVLYIYILYGSPLWFLDITLVLKLPGIYSRQAGSERQIVADL